MPSVSKRQFKFMAMLSKNPKRAKEVGISPEKAHEFVSKTPSYKDLPEKKKRKK